MSRKGRRSKQILTPALMRVEGMEPRLLLSADTSIFANIPGGSVLAPGDILFLEGGNNDPFDYEFYRTVDGQESLYTTRLNQVGAFSANLEPGEYRARTRPSGSTGTWVETCFTVAVGVGPDITAPAEGTDFTGDLPVSWESVAGAQSYEVELRVFSGHGRAEVVETWPGITGTTFTVPDASTLGGRRYVVYVRGILSTGATTFKAVTDLSDITNNLREPVGIFPNVDNDLNVSVRLSPAFTVPNTTAEVELYINPVGNRSTPVYRDRVDLPVSRQVDIPQQLQNDDYEIWARLHYSDGTFTRWGTPETFTISDGDVDSTPMLLTPTYQGGYDISQTTFNLTWTQSVLDESYEVWIAPHDNIGNAVVNVTGITATSFQTDELAPDTYTIQVRAHLTNGGTSAWSEARTFAVHPDGVDPIVITGGVGQQQDTTPLIEWNPIGNVDNGYELFISRADSPSTPVYRRTGLQGSSHEVETALEEGVAYSVWVRAAFDIRYLRVWNTPWGTATALTIGAAANSTTPVPFPQVADSNDTTPTLAWDARANVAQYEIWIGVKGNRTAPVYHRRGLTTASHTVETDLPGNAVLEGWIRAHYADGTRTNWGPPTEFTIETDDAGPSLEPLVFLSGLDDPTDATPELRWNDPGGVSYFDLYINEVGSRSTPVYRRRVYSGSMHVLEEPLAANTDYEFWIRGVYTLGGQTRWGTPTLHSTTTLVADLDQATPVVQASQELISWNAIPDATRYHVEVSLIYESIDRGTVIDVVSNRTVTETSMIPDFRNGDYLVTVRAEGDEGVFSNTSAQESFTINIDLSPPSLNIDNNVVSWQAVSLATDYRLWVNQYDDNGTLVQGRVADVETTDSSVTLDLGPGNYRVWLRVARGSRNSEWSPAYNFVIS